MSTTSRARGLAALGAALLATALASLPAAATAAPFDLALSQAKPDPHLRQLTLRARCSPGCTVVPVKLGAVGYRTRGGALQQLPLAAEGPLRGRRAVPAGRTVAIALPVPPAVEQLAATALPRGEALVGNVVVQVEQSGRTTEAVRQFTVTGPGTKAPFPASSALDAIRVATKPKGTAARGRWKVSVAGTQTSTWSYDRTRQEGGCRVIAAGSGRQKLTFRSTASPVVEEIEVPGMGLTLSNVATRSTGAFLPIRITAVRDSSETKGAEGDCGGGVGGGEGGGGQPPQCTRTGGIDGVFLADHFGDDERLGGFVTGLSFMTPSTLPDCPIELAGALRDPLDVLAARFMRGGSLAGGGSPGKVLVVQKASDVTKIGGGTVRTTARWTITFRRVK